MRASRKIVNAETLDSSGLWVRVSPAANSTRHPSRQKHREEVHVYVCTRTRPAHFSTSPARACVPGIALRFSFPATSFHEANGVAALSYRTLDRNTLLPFYLSFIFLPVRCFVSPRRSPHCHLPPSPAYRAYRRFKNSNVTA